LAAAAATFGGRRASAWLAGAAARGGGPHTCAEHRRAPATPLPPLGPPAPARAGDRTHFHLLQREGFRDSVINHPGPQGPAQDDEAWRFWACLGAGRVALPKT
jgi:hypothetical protein